MKKQAFIFRVIEKNGSSVYVVDSEIKGLIDWSRMICEGGATVGLEEDV